MSSELSRLVHDLLWSLWRELGVPGVLQNHRLTAVDPELMIAVTPALARTEPRLLGQAYGWCASNSDLISASRLRGLLATLPRSWQTEFLAMASTLVVHAGLRWSFKGENQEAWPQVPDAQGRSPDLSRPALLRPRLRGLAGVGARADVLYALLARPGAWVPASALEVEGYTKRNIARILGELQSAGLAREQVVGNSLRFQLAHRRAVMEVVQAEGVAFPDWAAVFRLVEGAVELEQQEGKSAGVQRVAADKVRGQMVALSEQLWLDSPPKTKGESEAWTLMLDWFRQQLTFLADGSSPALAVEAVKAAAIPLGGEAWVWLSNAAPDRERVAGQLTEPQLAAAGVTFASVVPTSDGWRAYQLLFEPRLQPPAVRMKVEHLVHPLKVAWRTADP